MVWGVSGCELKVFTPSGGLSGDFRGTFGGLSGAEWGEWFGE